MKYRKKPLVIEAFCLGKDPMPDWFMDRVSDCTVVLRSNEIGLKSAEIETLEGKHLADLGDFIIKGIKGELYPCKPDIFKKSYDAVE